VVLYYNLEGELKLMTRLDNPVTSRVESTFQTHQKNKLSQLDSLETARFPLLLTGVF
jgi:hypothetical protein